MESQSFWLYFEFMSAFAPYQARLTSRPLDISFHINISASGEAGLSFSLSLSCSHLFWIKFMKNLQDFVERQK